MNMSAGQATLSWSDMSSTALNGGAAISSYAVDYSTDNVNWTNSGAGDSTSTSATVTGLVTGASYYFRVRAVNAAGNGAYSTTGPRVIATALTVTYATQGGSELSSATWNIEGSLALPAAPTRAGYTFNGWYDAATGGTRVGGASASYTPTNTTNFTIYAQWSGNSNALTFDTQGGSSVSASTFTTGGSITLPAAPTLAGFTFNGWYLATSGGSSIGAAGATYSPVATSALIIYAQWVTTRALTIDNATYLASYASTAAIKPTLTATTTAGVGSGAITFTSATTSICTVNSTTGLVAFVAIGTCSISAAITAAVGFAAATSPSISFAIRAIPGVPTSPTAVVGN